MPKKGPPDADEAQPLAKASFNAPKADSATLQALLGALKTPTQAVAERPISPVQAILGSIIGALDPAGYERLVRPALEERKTEAIREYETARERRGENIEALAAIHGLERQGELDAAAAKRQAEKDVMDRARFVKDMDDWHDEEAEEEEKRLLESQALAAELATMPSRFAFAEELQKSLLSAPATSPGWERLHEAGRQIGYTITGIATALGEPTTGLAARMQTQPGTVSSDNIAMYRRMLPDLEKAIINGQRAQEEVAQAVLAGSLVTSRQELAREHKVKIRNQTVEQNLVAIAIQSASLKKAMALLDKYGEGSGDIGGPLEYTAPVRYLQQALGLQRAKDTATFAAHLSNSVYGYITANAGKAFTANEAVWLDPLLVKASATYTDKKARLEQLIGLTDAKLEGYAQEFDISQEEIEQLRGRVDAAVSRPGTTAQMVLTQMKPGGVLVPGVKAHVPAPSGTPPGVVALPFAFQGKRMFYDPNSNQIMVDDPNAP